MLLLGNVMALGMMCKGCSTILKAVASHLQRCLVVMVQPSPSEVASEESLDGVDVGVKTPERCHEFPNVGVCSHSLQYLQTL